MATAEIAYFDRDAGRASFGLELFRQIANSEPQSNILISPVSIGLLLAILYHGAKGATKDEISAALGATDAEDLDRSRRCWLDALRHSGKDVTVELANSLWLQQGITLRREYEQTVKLQFEAWVEVLDLQTEEALRRINEWAGQATSGKIPNVLSEIDPATVQIAASAIWFKGSWLDPFGKKDTCEQTFHAEPGPVLVPFMRQGSHFRYAENEHFQAVALPYEGWRFAMYVFLPKRSLLDLIAQASMANWARWYSSFASRPGTLELPRFTMSCSANLNKSLKALGVSRMFQPNADFSGMGDTPTWVSKITHKSFIEVNEEGTEAAAITIVDSVFGKDIEITPPEPFRMVVDRPFLYAIVDSYTGGILFIGAVNEIG